MKDFNKQFSDFLENRLGEKISWLRYNNEQYKIYLDERSKLADQQFESISEYKNAFTRLMELNGIISDIESNYLFLMGMREYQDISRSLSSLDFIDEFIGTENN